MNIWNKMIEEKAVKKQNSKKWFAKKEDACSIEGVLYFLDSTAHLNLKLACPTLANQS